jgi:hypothetical protein
MSPGRFGFSVAVQTRRTKAAGALGAPFCHLDFFG